jgi:glycosyltransferase involved in cell wall biosynthesis
MMINHVIGVCAVTPRVQVFIPTYNRVDRLRAAVGSVLAQTCPSVEVVVLDNHSTDGTNEVMQGIVAKDPRVRHVRRPSNIGMFGNLNAIAGLVDGDFFAMLTDDDTYEPEFVETAVQLFDQWPDIDLVACDAPSRYHGVVKGSQMDYWKEGYYRAGSGVMKCLLNHYPLITNCLFRARLRGEFHFRPELGNTGDAYILTSVFAAHATYVSHYRSGYWNNDGDNASSREGFNSVVIANTAMAEYRLYRQRAREGRFGRRWLAVAWLRCWMTVLLAADRAGFAALRRSTMRNALFGPVARIVLAVVAWSRIIRIVPSILTIIRRWERACTNRVGRSRAR